jgi:spermidine dehydrogenase
MEVYNALALGTITRRDFLNGVAVTAAGLAAAWRAEFQGLAQAPYPPSLVGMRGSDDASYATAHELRDGAFWKNGRAPVDTGERYDLVVVGAGISGLASAHFFRHRAGSRARVLILDNHDDFGGHARRNEFSVGGRVLVGYGGTQLIHSPRPYSRQARGLLTTLGVDPAALEARATDTNLYDSLKLGKAVFFDRETFGRDYLAVGIGERPWKEVLGSAPLSLQARLEIERIETASTDYLPGLSVAAKKRRLRKISYSDYLTKIAKVGPEAIKYYQTITHDLYGVGIDAVSAIESCELGYPGFQGLRLGATSESEEAEKYRFHFPDGNASIARLLVRALVPAAMPGGSVDDIVASRADYGRLDDADAPVRIRLRSTVVRVRHTGPQEREVEIAYVRDGRLVSVQGGACVLACWHSVIPHLCPELPAAQQDALRYGVKVPLIYTNVALRSWSSFKKLGIRSIEAPGGFHNAASLDDPIRLGTFASARAPEEPIVLHLLRTPCSPGKGLSSREQHRVGRLELLSMPFETFEQRTRDQLGRMLGAGGFDPGRDIAGITVNRWAHGYAYEYSTMWDPDWPEAKKPCVLARKPFGRITIANSDAGAYAYTDSAIDQAWRAVNELTASSAPKTAARFP